MNDEDLSIEGISQSQIDEIRRKAYEQARTHTWRQKGFTLLCISCEFQHGTEIPHNLELTGITPDGLPILTVKKNI